MLLGLLQGLLDNITEPSSSSSSSSSSKERLAVSKPLREISDSESTTETIHPLLVLVVKEVGKLTVKGYKIKLCHMRDIKTNIVSNCGYLLQSDNKATQHDSY